MNKKLSTILTIVLSLTAVGLAFVPHTANAVSIDLFPDFVVNNILTTVSYAFLTLMSSLVTIAGTFLSVSINITTHIKEIFDKIPGIDLVWVTVRDLSSIFIIFVLLFVSIKMILGLKGANFGQLVVNVFLAGMLINFSLFFVKVAVDASNLISLQFYNAIAPQTSQNWTVNSAFYDGGLSNILLQSLRVQTVYNSVDLTKNEGIAGSILLATVGGGVMMLVAAFSFFAAAIAFTVRTAILLVIMALSPLYFVGMIFPEVKKQVSDKIMGMLRGQLIFMPVYLFLMYVALRIISDPQFMAIFNNSSSNGDKGFLGAMSLGVIIQYVIAIVFINMPLFAAIKMGAVGASWAPQAKDFGGFLGRNTLGRIGQGLGKSFDRTAARSQNYALGRIGSSILSSTGVSRKLRGALTDAEKGKYGGSESLTDIQKFDSGRKKEVSGFQRTEEQMGVINSALGTRSGLGKLNVALGRSGGMSPSELKTFRDTVGKMSDKEIGKIDFDKIKDPLFASAIPASKFDSLMKSDELTTAQQGELKAARETGFKEILDTEGADHLLKTVLKGKPQDIAKLPGDILKDPKIAEKLDPATLRKMVDENVGKEVRDEVRRIIENHASVIRNNNVPQARNDTQKAYDYLTNSQAGWTF